MHASTKLFLLLIFGTWHAKAQSPSNPQLAHALDSILVLDQSLREGYDSMQKKYTWEAPEMRAYWNEVSRRDSLNQRFVFPLLDAHGWPSKGEIGVKGINTLFLVVQHAEKEAQEKYLPLMQQAAKKGDLKRSELAMLEDRMNMGNGRFQLYGSQLTVDNKTNEWALWPIQDPDGVDKRRKAVGLAPMQENLNRWNLKWDVAEYKKNLPALQKKWLYATPPDAR